MSILSLTLPKSATYVADTRNDVMTGSLVSALFLLRCFIAVLVRFLNKIVLKKRTLKTTQPMQ